jgi:DNA polymerase
LDRALAEAGLDRAALYLTNAVKHFKYAPRGRRRIHQKPNAGEVAACRWWLDRELAAVQPRLVVALGATAAAALAQRPVSVTRERGPARFGAREGYVTVHPSFLLRLPAAGRRGGGVCGVCWGFALRLREGPRPLWCATRSDADLEGCGAAKRNNARGGS